MRADPVPLPVLVVFRGIGQIWFQEHALTGALFALGIAICFPVQAVGIVLGSVIGTAVAWGLKYDKGEILAGIYGFNPALVGIATFFFFAPGATSIGLMVAGCVVATVVTRGARGYVPFPTYTAPFVITTWAVFLVGRAMGAAGADAGANLVPTPTVSPGVEAILHGVGQVMFQASIWTGILFLVGIAVSDREHAAWSLVAAVIGMVVVNYHLDAAARALDPERLVERDQLENVRLGLYGYNATLAAVALYLWRRSLIAPLVGVVLTVPLTELVPRLGVPALTAPFVLATWIVLALGRLEGRLFGGKVAAPA
ncbi:urea transporter [bacterium]|nr:urea transporter [bacterium]